MGAPTTQVTLIGLNEYTNYSITVFASTVKGGGRISAPIFVMTGKGCKLLYLRTVPTFVTALTFRASLDIWVS